MDPRASCRFWPRCRLPFTGTRRGACRPCVPVTPTMSFKIDPSTLHCVDRLEFWVGFIGGAIFGVISGIAWVSVRDGGPFPWVSSACRLGVSSIAVGFSTCRGAVWQRLLVRPPHPIAIPFSDSRPRQPVQARSDGHQHKKRPTGKKPVGPKNDSRIIGRSARWETMIPPTIHRWLARSPIPYTSPPLAPQQGGQN